ncbi:MAG: hypothetical protein IPG63_15345 [Xanthomonadales bacterium]|nr:hypothetical protein [Xanthomonadales bacterium]
MDGPENAHAPTMRDAAADFGEFRQADDTAAEITLLQRYLLLRNASVDRRLSAAAVAVLAVVVDHVNSRTGKAFPGFDRMRGITGLHRTSGMRGAAELERFGYIEVQRELNRPNRYLLTAWPTSNEWPTSRASATGSANATGHIDATGSAEVTGRIRVSDRSHARTKPVASVHKTGRIDATRTCSLTKEQLDKSNQSPASPGYRFHEFWAIYPRKEAKAPAEKAWASGKLDQLADAINADVAARIAACDQWQDRRFVPLPATYLRGKRWNDEWRSDDSTTPHQRLGEDGRTDDELDAAAAQQLARWKTGATT